MEINLVLFTPLNNHAKRNIFSSPGDYPAGRIILKYLERHKKYDLSQMNTV